MSPSCRRKMLTFTKSYVNDLMMKNHLLIAARSYLPPFTSTPDLLPVILMFSVPGG